MRVLFFHILTCYCIFFQPIQYEVSSYCFNLHFYCSSMLNISCRSYTVPMLFFECSFKFFCSFFWLVCLLIGLYAFFSVFGYKPNICLLNYFCVTISLPSLLLSFHFLQCAFGTKFLFEEVQLIVCFFNNALVYVQFLLTFGVWYAVWVQIHLFCVWISSCQHYLLRWK